MVSPCQSRTDEPRSSVGAGGDDALPRLAGPLASQRAVVGAAAGSTLGASDVGSTRHGCPATMTAAPSTGHYFVKTGSVSQPRTVEVGESRALSRSTSHSGKRVRTSSRAMHPLHAGERRAHAQVDAVAEGEMPAVVAVDVEACRRRGSVDRPGWPSPRGRASRCRPAPRSRGPRGPGAPCSDRRGAPATRSAGSLRWHWESARDRRRARPAGQGDRPGPWRSIRSDGSWSRCRRRRATSR